MTELGDITLVTGATGLVGSALCRRLAGRGARLRALVQPTSNASFLKDLGVELTVGDVAEQADCRRAAEGVKRVFHCAAYVSDWAEAEEMIRINVEGLHSMIEASLDADVERFVYLSSLVVLGHGPQKDLDEAAPVVLTGDTYNKTKVMAEELALRHFRNRGLPLVIIRPPYIYGPKDRQFLPRLIPNLKSGAFRYIGSGFQPLSLVYVENLVDAMLLASEKPEAVGQTYHVTDGPPVTRRELIDALCDGLNLPRPTRQVPYGVAKILSHLMEVTYRMLGKREAPLLNRFRLKFMATPLTFSIEKARRELGYEPRFTFAEGMAETLAWWREREARES